MEVTKSVQDGIVGSTDGLSLNLNKVAASCFIKARMVY